MKSGSELGRPPMSGGHERERFLRNAVSTDDLPTLVSAAEWGGWSAVSLVLVFESLDALVRIFSEPNE